MSGSVAFFLSPAQLRVLAAVHRCGAVTPVLGQWTQISTIEGLVARGLLRAGAGAMQGSYVPTPTGEAAAALAARLTPVSGHFVPEEGGA